MNEIKDTVRKLFANTSTQPAKFPAPNELRGLNAPGIGFKQPVPLSDKLHAGSAAPVVEPVVAPVITQPAQVCSACGQRLPEKIVAEVVEQVPSAPKGPVDLTDDHRAIDWDEEKRTDLFPRNRRRIKYLLQFETAEQTQARILSDQMRFAWTQGR
jgi:hypothetical protein